MPRLSKKRVVKKKKVSRRRVRRAVGPGSDGWISQTNSVVRSRYPIVARDPFGPRLNVTLCYGKQLSLSATTGNTFGAQQTFRLNSVFQCDVTGATGQPRYFDTYSTLYARYKVTECWMDIEFNNTSGVTGSVAFAMVGGTTTLPTLAAANIDAFIDSPAVTTLPIGSSDGGDNIRRYQHKVDLAYLEGVSRMQYNADLNVYAALVSANPSRNMLVTFAVAPGTSATIGLNVTAKLYYKTQFFDRIVIGQS